MGVPKYLGIGPDGSVATQILAPVRFEAGGVATPLKSALLRSLPGQARRQRKFSYDDENFFTAAARFLRH